MRCRAPATIARAPNCMPLAFTWTWLRGATISSIAGETVRGCWLARPDASSTGARVLPRARLKKKESLAVRRTSWRGRHVESQPAIRVAVPASARRGHDAGAAFFLRARALYIFKTLPAAVRISYTDEKIGRPGAFSSTQ